MSQPKSLDILVKQTLKELGWEDNYSESNIARFWNDMFDGKGLSIAKVKKFSKGYLTMNVESSTWRYELNLRKEEIKSQLNEKLGTNIIREIIFK
jgi:predicted nucleic acid-binding Zn ribbon protein